MAIVLCHGTRVALASGETVLEGLLRAGVQVAHSCRAGACQSCLVRATAGTAPAPAQSGLKDTLRARGFFLACRAVPTDDLTVALDDREALGTKAQMTAVEPLGADVVRVRLAPEAPFAYEAGQFLNLRRADGLTRSYSLASLPDTDKELEIHVRVLARGRMSTWLADPARVGDQVDIRGPSGGCFYVAGRPEQSLLLVGTGTGLAPLWGVMRAALRAGHTGPIRLFHGARSPAGFYLVRDVQTLAQAHVHVEYVRGALEGDAADGLHIGPLDKILLERLPNLSGQRVFICGDPDLVLSLRKKVFLAGASLTEIHSDAFLTAGN